MKWLYQYILLYFPGDSKTSLSWESIQCAFILFPWGYNVMTCSPWKISGHCKMSLCWWCHVNLWFSYMLDIGSCEPWNFSGVMMKTLKQRGIVCLFQWRPVSNNSLTSAIQEVMVPWNISDGVRNEPPRGRSWWTKSLQGREHPTLQCLGGIAGHMDNGDSLTVHWYYFNRSKTWSKKLECWVEIRMSNSFRWVLPFKL